jgi:hypothetical protein
MRRVVLWAWIVWCFVVVGFLIIPAWYFHIVGYVLVSATLAYVGFPTVAARLDPDETEADDEPETNPTPGSLGSRTYPRRASWSDGRG